MPTYAEAIKLPPPIPTVSLRIVSTRIITLAAIRRGVTSFLIGSVPSVLRASICSVTRIEPICAAIPDPTRPATRIAASTGPSSRLIDPVTRGHMFIVAPNGAICTEV